MNTTDKAIDLVVQLEKRIAELERDQATLLRAIESWKKEELSWIEDGKALRARIETLKDAYALRGELVAEKSKRIEELEEAMKKIQVIRKDYSYDYMLVIRTICDETLERKP